MDSAGHATVTPDYFPNLQGGQDSVVFDHEGHLIVSFTDLQTLAELDPTSRMTLRRAINTTPIPSVADLALDPASDTVWGIEFGGTTIARVDLGTGATTLFHAPGVTGVGRQPPLTQYYQRPAGETEEFERWSPTFNRIEVDDL